MTQTRSGADYRGYYAELGIPVPSSAEAEASVRCFANPDAHRRGDRHPSCSVNLEHGAWHCHTCGAKGGAYDAATLKGYSRRDAIGLMVRFGITNWRSDDAGRLVRPRPLRPVAAARPERIDRARALSAEESDVRRWAQALARRSSLVRHLRETRGWELDAIRELELGLDRGRITIPIRDGQHRLQGVLRYHPDPGDRPKMLAARGTRLGLIPHPASESSSQLLLVEGPPDMITARSYGATAIAVPGDHAWRAEWAPLLQGRSVTIIMDCDQQGRAAAQRIAHDLSGVAHTETVDLAPERENGYDLTDWLREGSELGASAGRSACVSEAPDVA